MCLPGACAVWCVRSRGAAAVMRTIAPSHYRKQWVSESGQHVVKTFPTKLRMISGREEESSEIYKPSQTQDLFVHIT